MSTGRRISTMKIGIRNHDFKLIFMGLMSDGTPGRKPIAISRNDATSCSQRFDFGAGSQLEVEKFGSRRWAWVGADGSCGSELGGIRGGIFDIKSFTCLTRQGESQ